MGNMFINTRNKCHPLSLSTCYMLGSALVTLETLSLLLLTPLQEGSVAPINDKEPESSGLQAPTKGKGQSWVWRLAGVGEGHQHPAKLASSQRGTAAPVEIQSMRWETEAGAALCW